MENVQWVAGLLEGEGSFTKGPPSRPNIPAITCQMTDRDVIERLADELGGYAVSAMKPSKPHHKPTFQVQVRGARAVEIMTELLPWMGQRRQGQMQAALDCYRVQERGKTTAAQRTEIVRRFEKGEAAKDLASEFGVTHWAIYRMRDAAKARLT